MFRQRRSSTPELLIFWRPLGIGFWRPLGLGIVSWRLLGLGILVAMVAACTSAVDEPGSTGIEGLIEEEAQDNPADLVFDSSDSITLAGVSVNPSKIEPGDCFNEYLFRDQSDFVQQVTTVVGCDGPHDREAYFSRQYAGSELENYPLEEELLQWAQSMCLDEFEEFIGLEYVLSALEIGAITPTFEGWTDDGDRNVICYVYPDQGGRLLASVGNSGI